MGQLEDFRASLKRKDSAVSSEGEIPVKSIAKAKQEKMKRRTLGVSGGEEVCEGERQESRHFLHILPRLHFKVFLHCHLHYHHYLASTFISSQHH